MYQKHKLPRTDDNLDLNSSDDETNEEDEDDMDVDVPKVVFFFFINNLDGSITDLDLIQSNGNKKVVKTSNTIHPKAPIAIRQTGKEVQPDVNMRKNVTTVLNPCYLHLCLLIGLDEKKDVAWK